MRGIAFTTGTKDKMSPSASATTNCQLRIRRSRQAGLNKPVNMALLTSCIGVPRHDKMRCLLIPDDGRLIFLFFFFFPKLAFHVFAFKLPTSESDIRFNVPHRWRGRYLAAEMCAPVRLNVWVNLKNHLRNGAEKL